MANIYRGDPVDLRYPNKVGGQLIVSKGTDFFIVVKTREISEYQEETGTHYKIGGFVKVDPNSLERYDRDNQMYVKCGKEG